MNKLNEYAIDAMECHMEVMRSDVVPARLFFRAEMERLMALRGWYPCNIPGDCRAWSRNRQDM